MSAAAASIRGSTPTGRALLPDTADAGAGGSVGAGPRGGGAGAGRASSSVSCTTTGRPVALPAAEGIWRNRLSASSSLPISVSMACGRGRRVARTAAISSSTRGCGERRISASASRKARST